MLGGGDWPGIAGEMAARVRVFDWAATPLGPTSGWPERLRAIVEQVLASPLVATVALLDDRLLIYNDVAAALYGDRHPGALGRPLALTFPDSYPSVTALYDRVFAGETLQVAAQQVAVGTGAAGEVFDAWLNPVWDAAGAVIGAFMSGVEISGRLQRDGARAVAEAASREAETRYLTLVNAIDQGFCTIELAFDADGRPTDYRFLEVSPSFEAQTGIADAAGRWMRELAPDQDQHWFDIYGRVASTGESVRFEDFSTPLGRWWEIFAFRVEDPALHRVGVLFRDIGERKRIEAATRESEQRLQRVLETDAVAVLFFTAAGVLTDANDVFLRMTGYSRADVAAGRLTWQNMTPAEYHAESQAQMDAFFATGRIGPYEKEYLRKDGSRAWMLFAGRDLGDGTIVELGVDITDRKRAEAALRESELRLQQFGEASQDVLWVRDAETLQWENLTPAFETIYGLDRAAALRGDNMTGWLDLILPEDREHAARSIARVHAGEWVTFEFRIRRPSDGGIRWLRNTDFPIQDAAGKVVRIGGIGHDITEMKRAEAAIAASETRLRTLIDGIPQLVWRSCDRGQWTWASPQWLAFTGQTQAQTHGSGWLDAVHPDDRVATLRARDAALPHGRLDVEYRVRHAADGAWLWHHTRSVPVRDANDRIVEWLGTSTDIEDLREMQSRQHILVTELQHRTFNLIGVVRSMADATLRSSGSLDEFRAKFRDRIDALARVQRLLSRLKEGDRITFDELIRTELAAAGALQRDDGRVTLVGPDDVTLRSATVQTFALAIHELTTNALKYGALKQPSAHLDVRWRVEPEDGDQPWLYVDWTETGVAVPPAGAEPARTGQGRVLIEEALPYQLHARTSYVIAADGVRCSIALPVSRHNGGQADAK